MRAMVERTASKGWETGRWLLLAAVVAQFADAFTFATAIRSGIPITAESNPVMAFAYQADGLVGPVELKMVAITMMVLLVAAGQLSARLPAVRQAVVVGASVLIGCIGVVGSLSNLHAIAALAIP